jgi:hypothetical protein
LNDSGEEDDISWGGRVRHAATAAVLVLVLSSCAIHDLAFVKDDRLRIVSPSEFARVSQPVTLSWTARYFTVTGADGRSSPNAGYFAVFVDTHPQPAGKTLADLAKGDKTCLASQGCPNTAYFLARRIYVTQSTHFTIPSLPPPPLGSRTGDQVHAATVIMLDGGGHRIGESGYATVDLRVPVGQEG